MKIAFLGTPEFALPSLDMLYQSGHELGVFTQPDRPVGRHAVLTPPPTKAYALEHSIPVFQFEKIRLPEGVEALKAFAPDLMVTAAFGQILSAENLAIPKYGCINVHGSLLPKYRGAAPIQWAIINGETETGITTMMTDVGMDTGDILLVDRVSIGENETAGELFERLSVLGAETLKRTITALEAGTLVRIPQVESQATKCPCLKKSMVRSILTRPRGKCTTLCAARTLAGRLRAAGRRTAQDSRNALERMRFRFRPARRAQRRRKVGFVCPLC
jgi:methionyl-tRNA formyltransferase